VYSSWHQLSYSPLRETRMPWDHTVLPATRQKWESCLYPQPKQVLDLAIPEGCKAELTCVTWKRTGWDLNPRPVNLKSNALPQRHYATLLEWTYLLNTPVIYANGKQCLPTKTWASFFRRLSASRYKLTVIFSTGGRLLQTSKHCIHGWDQLSLIGKMLCMKH